MKNIADSLRSLFKNSLNLPLNNICKNCSAIQKEPLLAFVGKQFDEKDRILFVRVDHNKNIGTLTPDKFRDPTKYMETHWGSNDPYLRLLRLITTPLYGDKGHRFISMADLTKCATGEVQGSWTGNNNQQVTQVNKQVLGKCFNQQQVIWKEASILKPGVIVIFGSDLFKDKDSIKLPIAKSTTTIQPINNTEKCVTKNLPWCELLIKTDWSPGVRILILDYPEGYNQEEMAKMISNWIQEATNKSESEVTLGSALRRYKRMVFEILG